MPPRGSSQWAIGRLNTWRRHLRASTCACRSRRSRRASVRRMASMANSRCHGRTKRLVVASRLGRVCPGKAKRHLHPTPPARTFRTPACEWQPLEIGRPAQRRDATDARRTTRALKRAIRQHASLVLSPLRHRTRLVRCGRRADLSAVADTGRAAFELSRRAQSSRCDQAFAVGSAPTCVV